jgi:hypothetical protein
MLWLIAFAIITAAFVGFAVACLACAADCDNNRPTPDSDQ